ncbi:MAG: hypothetical protein HY036_11675 [Nitrospirae bacterium]|nr:hypothetical protein [Nitrospirota bacterium]
MKRLRNLIGCFVILLSLISCQKETSTLVPDTNWADITLEEKGFGGIELENSSNDSANRVESYRDAKAALFQKLEATIMSLKIDPKRDVKTFIGTNQKLKEKVAAFIRTTRITEAVYTPRKGMELKGQLYLGEGFKSILGLMEKKTPEEKSPAHSSPAGSSHGTGF